MPDTDDTGCQQGPEAASFSQAPPLARRLRALILESDLREVTEGLSPTYCVTSGKTLNLPGEQFPHRKSRANWEDDSPQIKLLSDGHSETVDEPGAQALREWELSLPG